MQRHAAVAVKYEGGLRIEAHKNGTVPYNLPESSILANFGIGVTGVA